MQNATPSNTPTPVVSTTLGMLAYAVDYALSQGTPLSALVSLLKAPDRYGGMYNMVLRPENQHQPYDLLDVYLVSDNLDAPNPVLTIERQPRGYSIGVDLDIYVNAQGTRHFVFDILSPTLEVFPGMDCSLPVNFFTGRAQLFDPTINDTLLQHAFPHRSPWLEHALPFLKTGVQSCVAGFAETSLSSPNEKLVPVFIFEFFVQTTDEARFTSYSSNSTPYQQILPPTHFAEDLFNFQIDLWQILSTMEVFNQSGPTALLCQLFAGETTAYAPVPRGPRLNLSDAIRYRHELRLCHPPYAVSHDHLKKLSAVEWCVSYPRLVSIQTEVFDKIAASTGRVPLCYAQYLEQFQLYCQELAHRVAFEAVSC